MEVDNEENEDFQVIFDYLPKISFYQAAIVFLTGMDSRTDGRSVEKIDEKTVHETKWKGYCNVAAGSLQLAQIILQANPGNLHLHTNTDPPTRALTRSG